MNHPTPQITERLEKLYHSLDVTVEEISNILYSGNLIVWAEDVIQSGNASEKDLDTAAGILDVVDRLSL